MVFNTAFLVFLGIYIIYCMMLYLNGVSDKEYVYFGIGLGVYTLYFVMDSGMYTHIIGAIPDATGVAIFLGTLFPPIVLVFMFYVFGKGISAFVRYAVYIWILVAVVGVFEPFFNSILRYVYWIFWGLLALLSSFILIRAALIAKEEGFYESTPALVGIFWLVLGMVFVELDQLRIVNVTYYLKHIAVVLFMFSVEYGLIKRYARYWRDVKYLSENIVKARDEERRKLSRDIHDGVGQLLTSIKLNLQMIRASERDDKLKEVMGNLISNVSLAIEEVRNIAMDLKPIFLEKFSLSEILQWYVARYKDRFGVKVFLNVDDDIEADLSVKDNIYRICQEALSNVFKHSRARVVRISLKKSGGRIILEVADDGVGFCPERLVDRGMGLHTMRERAEVLKGDFSLKSAPGKGCVVTVRIPLND